MGRAITAYEQQITRLEERKVELSESIKKCGRPLRDFDGTFRTAFEFLGNPQKLWHSKRLEERRLVLKMAFADRLPYVRNEGFRTAPIALPFRVLQQLEDPNCKMARPGGESSNSLFETLADWEEQLKHLDIDFDALESGTGDGGKCDLEGPTP